MPEWRSYGYIASISLLFPCTVLLLAYQGKTLSVTWLSVFGLLYAWTSTNIVYPFFCSPLRGLPEPPGEWFLFGHGPVMISRPPGQKFLEWMQQLPNDGLIHFRSFLHWRSRVLLTKPETLAEVLTGKPYDWHKPGPAKRFLARIIGYGLINVEDHEHKMQRKGVAPAFQGRHIRDLVPVFWRQAIKLADAIVLELDVESTSVDGLKTGVIEINAMVSRITLDIIGQAGLGRDFDTISNAENELAQQYAVILNPDRPALVLYFAVNMFLPQWFVRKLPWKMNRIVADAASNLRLICRRLVAEKKQAIADKSEDQVDILSVLIRSGSFDDGSLVDQLLTFLAAGHETTSSALTWSTYLLSMHPEIQKQLREEVCYHLKQIESPEKMNATILDSMPLLSAVCNESLRLFPTVPATGREAARQTTIGNQVIPKGTFALVCPWAINRLEALWGPDAAEFKPSRWLGEGKAHVGSAMSSYSFLSFLHGPRSCVGQGFARTELKCLLAVLIWRFDMELADPARAGKVVPAGVITIKPRGGMHLRLRQRV